MSLSSLPEGLYHQIWRLLEERDQKNLSLTCSQLLLRCEQTFTYAPKLYIAGHRQANPETLYSDRVARIMSCPENIRPDADYPYPPKLISKWLSESDSMDQEGHPVEFRRQRRLDFEHDGVWLCPHVACTKTNLEELMKPLRAEQDTIQAACIFPKCSLWARHALTSRTKPIHRTGPRSPRDIVEICSVIKAYRIVCPFNNIKQIRDRLLTVAPSQLQKAMGHLQVPICRHLNLGSESVTQCFQPGEIAIIPPIPGLDGIRCWGSAAALHFDQGHCRQCRAEGARTTWGFFARPCTSELSAGNAQWLDIELTFSRPLTGPRSPFCDDINWVAHWMQTDQLPTFVDGWWKWAEQVAEEGFDWTARLPPRFLQTNKSALINFPSRLPPYDSYNSYPMDRHHHRNPLRAEYSITMRVMDERLKDEWAYWRSGLEEQSKHRDGVGQTCRPNLAQDPEVEVDTKSQYPGIKLARKLDEKLPTLRTRSIADWFRR